MQNQPLLELLYPNCSHCKYQISNTKGNQEYILGILGTFSAKIKISVPFDHHFSTTSKPRNTDWKLLFTELGSFKAVYIYSFNQVDGSQTLLETFVPNFATFKLLGLPM